MENPMLTSTVKSTQFGLAYLPHKPPVPPGYYIAHNMMAVQHQNRQEQEGKDAN